MKFYFSMEGGRRETWYWVLERESTYEIRLFWKHISTILMNFRDQSRQLQCLGIATRKSLGLGSGLI